MNYILGYVTCIYKRIFMKIFLFVILVTFDLINSIIVLPYNPMIVNLFD